MSQENLVLETKLYNLSTRTSACKILNEDTDYKSKCEYNIPNLIARDDTIEYIQFSVPDCIIPVSYYIINENNCRLDIIENGVAASYTFPLGNYNANIFIKQFAIILGSNRWSLALSDFNSIFTVKNTQYTFSFLATSTIKSIVGFSNTLISTGNSLVMTRCCNFLPLARVNIRCAELANATVVGAGKNFDDVIITIPNNARPNGQIFYQNMSYAKLLFRHQELSRFVVSFTDDDGNFINFHGVPSFFSLQFDIYRKWQPKLPRFSNIVSFVNQNQKNKQDFQDPSHYFQNDTAETILGNT